MNDINCQIACYCGCGLCPPYFDDVSDLQLYDISFLKLSELLLESNPGPTQNVSKSQVNSILVKLKVSYDISFLYHAQFIIDGDVESNPGPTSIESYRASIGVFLLEFYDSSFLKRFKLLIDGDIESNPGPTQNSIDKTPRSVRRKQNRGFKGTPKKQKIENINFTINCTIPDPCAPFVELW